MQRPEGAAWHAVGTPSGAAAVMVLVAVCCVCLWGPICSRQRRESTRLPDDPGGIPLRPRARGEGWWEPKATVIVRRRATRISPKDSVCFGVDVLGLGEAWPVHGTKTRAEHPLHPGAILGPGATELDRDEAGSTGQGPREPRGGLQ